MKVHEIRAAIEEYDKVKGDDPMSWWETTVRALLPIAEAVEEMAYNDDKLSDKVLEALKGLEE